MQPTLDAFRLLRQTAMDIIKLILAMLFGLGGLVCSIIILIDAFQDELWKGFVCILCGLYWLYYALVEFEHEHKWLIILGSLGGSAIGAGIMRL